MVSDSDKGVFLYGRVGPTRTCPHLCGRLGLVRPGAGGLTLAANERLVWQTDRPNLETETACQRAHPSSASLAGAAPAGVRLSVLAALCRSHRLLANRESFDGLCSGLQESQSAASRTCLAPSIGSGDEQSARPGQICAHRCADASHHAALAPACLAGLDEAGPPGPQ